MMAISLPESPSPLMLQGTTVEGRDVPSPSSAVTQVDRQNVAGVFFCPISTTGYGCSSAMPAVAECLLLACTQ